MENKQLRFGCPACGMRLVVDPSLAGVEGPCPSCGAKIIAPPLAVSDRLDSRTAAPVAIKPRGVVSSTGGKEDVPSAAPERAVPEPKPKPLAKTARVTRSVSPTTAISNKYEEKKEVMAFVKIACLAIVVALICGAVYFFLQGR